MLASFPPVIITTNCACWLLAIYTKAHQYGPSFSSGWWYFLLKQLCHIKNNIREKLSGSQITNSKKEKKKKEIALHY